MWLEDHKRYLERLPLMLIFTSELNNGLFKGENHECHFGSEAVRHKDDRR